MNTKLTRRLLATGFSSSLAVSFFTSASQQPVAGPDMSKPKNFDLIVQEADALYDSYLIDNAYSILRRFAKSDCSELLWRLARVVCEKAKLSHDKDQRKTLMYEALALVEKAIEKEPKDGCFGAHKWYAILLDYVGEIEGNKSRIQKSYMVKEHLERALQIRSNDATTWHILGVWHFSFADMGYATRLVAKTIFASPPSSTYEKALHYFLKAEEISVKEHLERALQICSNDATTWHILGVWHFSFADMGYATRLVAKTIFASPPSSTYEKALHYFLKAEEISPRFYSTNTYFIGEAYEKLGNKEEARKYYLDAFKMPVVTADDQQIHQKAFEKLRAAGLQNAELLQGR
ncbi:unnamed protein product [Strongylus vulgaris]|uniref:Regulator of microtubule dynamics protein 1 n=1 Tax=Strongylus vulgaris TaxID=40348 RepID=A0A3P7LF79_STRVU|nr:unnamed protein product [Strongylus vulgaris]